MITALSAGRASVFHLHSASDDWLINTGTESKWRHVTEPYLQATGVNRLGTIILTHNDLMRGGGVLEAARRFACNRFFIADRGQTRANAPVHPATGLQAWPGNGSFRSASGITISELRPIMGTRRQKGRNIFAFLCRFENWRFLIGPELTLETLESLAPPPVDVAFLSRIDSSSIPRLREKLALRAIICERNTGDITGAARERSQIPVFCLAVDGATMLSARGERLELRTFRGAHLTLTSRSR